MSDHLFGLQSGLNDPLGLQRIREAGERLSGQRLADAFQLRTSRWLGVSSPLAGLIPRVEIPGFTRLREQWGDQLLGASTVAALRERMAIDVEPLLAQASASSAVALVTGIGERFADLMPRVELSGVAQIAGMETWSAELGAPVRDSIARWQTEIAESTGALTQLAGLRERLADLTPRIQVDLPRVDLLLPEPLAEGIADPARAKPAAADPLAEVLARMDDALTLISETLAFMNGAEDRGRGQARHRLGQTAAAMAAFFALYGLLSPNPDVVRITAAMIGAISVWIMFIDYLARGE